MVEFEKKDNGKCLIIRPPMPPDEDEMIKETFFFLKHPNVTLSIHIETAWTQSCLVGLVKFSCAKASL